MDFEWKTILLSGQSLSNNDTTVNLAEINNLKAPRIYPLTHLCSLTVSGKDAPKLLQGQLTCNVNEINDTKGSYTALCNPKGRVIATFLLIKKADAFVLILPLEMLETVQKRLQMFVLRSDVKITDSTGELCLLGVYEPDKPAQPFSAEIQHDVIAVNLPGINKRQLLITQAETGVDYWSKQTSSGAYQPASTTEWQFLDLSSGLPWITPPTSEEFIPQMLNLDKLGGISFNKGCYTGQEIVARTHYLGKAKRELVLAVCDCDNLPEPMANVIHISTNDQEVAGKVLMAQLTQQGCLMQIILLIQDTGYTHLTLQTDTQNTLKLIPFNL